jgi:chemotaxis protein CheD
MNVVVGVSDMKVSNDRESTLVTYSLGSCIGIAALDPVAQVGGILNFMLPDSNVDPGKAEKNPCMFADTGSPCLCKSAYELGGKKQRMKVAVLGGSQVLDQHGFFNIGKRNFMAVRKMFWKNNVMIDYEDVGGNTNRTFKLLVKKGEIQVRVSGQEGKQICLI